MGKVVLILSLVLLSAVSNAQKNFQQQLADSALTLTKQSVRYDPAYFSIPYPNGDVPADRGVCTDVVIRAYRKLGIDLQREIHEDMRGNFDLYPKNWGLKAPDRNIDHRRVPNLMTYFGRHGKAMPVKKDAANYLPGDIICWDLGGGTTHIGIVSNKLTQQGSHYLVVHNIGSGQVLEDFLTKYRVIGHYRYGQ